MNTRDNAFGTMLGLACGDALGRPVEFRSPAVIQRRHGTVTDMLADGTHGQPAGTITDDTELALCLARSLVEQGGFDPNDIAERFVAWFESGPFDYGLMTADAIRKLRDGVSPLDAGREVWEASAEGSNAGNGSVMRCAPHALAFDNRETLVSVSRVSSAITHADPRCTAGCAVLNLTLTGLIRGDDNPLATALDIVDAPTELHDALIDVRSLESDDLANTGYVVTTLQAGLFHGLTAPDAETAIVDAVNMGGDADTIGAVAGAVAGARFGAENLPERWIGEIKEADKLRSLARNLHDGEFVTVGELDDSNVPRSI